jgi:hypothetical protein
LRRFSSCAVIPSLLVAFLVGRFPGSGVGLGTSSGWGLDSGWPCCGTISRGSSVPYPASAGKACLTIGWSDRAASAGSGDNR